MKLSRTLTLLAALLLLVSSAFANYDPQTGRFLSPDPLGHAASMSLYDYCNNDPVNNVDPDGRFGKGINSASTGDIAANAFYFGRTVGGMFSGAAEGAQGGSSITANTLTFGGSDALGWTGSNQYQGGVYTGTRILSTIGREAAITAVTLGTFQLARTGSEAALYGYQGLQVVNAGRSGYAIGSGIDQVSQGNNWGYLSIAGGTLGLAGGFTLTAIAPELNAGVQTMRQGVAQNFYKAAGWSQQRIADHLQGIDFNQPVRVVTLSQGSQVVQYQMPGSPAGNYFAPVGTPAYTLGIYTSGLQGTAHTATQPVTALRSAASPVVNTWSMSGAGWRIQTQGGGTQFFVPQTGGLLP